MMEVRRYSPEELAHYGVKGMHWGERRWQNEDGSLTEAGRSHYGRSIKKIQKLENRANILKKKAVKNKKKAADYEFRSLKAWTEKGARKLYYKSKKQTRKAARKEWRATKKIEKGKKIYTNLRNEFKDADISTVDKSYIDYGKKYATKYLK